MASNTANTLLSPLDVIFSCSICQATLSEIYATPQGDQGFNSKSDTTDKECLVTKLWLTECSHLTCSLHLEGGGIPFHPLGEKPSAPCPLCFAERADSSRKLLFGIVGAGMDEHDQDVPAAYFQMPPTKLGGNSPSSCGMRFQYLSLLRFGVTMHKKYTDAVHALADAEKTRNKVVRASQGFKDEAAGLREKVKELESMEGDYKSWKKREPEVRHYLRSFAAIARENDVLKKQLLRLGYQVPQTEWSMKPANGQAKCDDNSRTTKNAAHKSTGQSRGTNGYSPFVCAQTSGADYCQAKAKYRYSSSSRKRTHEEYAEDGAGILSGMNNCPPLESYNMIPRRQQLYQQSEERLQRIELPPVDQTLPNRYQAEHHVRRKAASGNKVYAGRGWQVAQPEPLLLRRGEFVMSSTLPPPNLQERQVFDPNRHNISHSNSTPHMVQSRYSLYLPALKQAQDYEHLAREQIYSRPPQQTNNAFQFHTGSRSSANREPLRGMLQSNTGTSNYPTNSGCLSNISSVRPPLHQPPPLPYNLDPITPAPPRQHDVHPPIMPSPFFTRAGRVADCQRRSHLFRPDTSGSAARHIYTQPGGSPMGQVGQSLNSLSFINSPYTHDNQRIIDDGSAVSAQNRLSSVNVSVQNQNKERGRVRQQLQPRISTLEESQPSYSLPSRKTFTREDDLNLLNTIRGAKSSVNFERDALVLPAVLPVSQFGTGGVMGRLLSAGGRRSVRR